MAYSSEKPLSLPPLPKPESQTDYGCDTCIHREKGEAQKRVHVVHFPGRRSRPLHWAEGTIFRRTCSSILISYGSEKKLHQENEKFLFFGVGGRGRGAFLVPHNELLVSFSTAKAGIALSRRVEMTLHRLKTRPENPTETFSLLHLLTFNYRIRPNTFQAANGKKCGALTQK